ncbi:uncharacterized protein MELLADRAFT_91927 [Melampsora larici-populina 98AG31]|uniref:Uncharacterized protein n=1 Tax=Melampsora larici-populina (strain 98AG31 / pathotype 3-4-7) TaxID=747676 RepID=F4S0X3_MELLP|nr:uncharacterized protein MELLADRAFT_91927 [Melampsora larici-populina 98AG31]EGG01734.1 hypothetical protein MELLADRAFT_91927 [Melampsora larici-populina 98AG31]
MSMATSSIFSVINTLINSCFINLLSNSISNISAHYDISNEMFEAFLSKDMTYSCGYFTEQLGGLVGDLQPHTSTLSKQNNQDTQDSLEEAQYAQLDLIICKANIGPTDHVLDIGGILPTVTFMADAITKGSKKQLIIDSIGNSGPYYACTLREWQHRFELNFESLIIPSLISSYPDLEGPPEQIEVFRRKWLCECPLTRRPKAVC